jgi:hypothetical protein
MLQTPCIQTFMLIKPIKYEIEILNEYTLY